MNRRGFFGASVAALAGLVLRRRQEVKPRSTETLVRGEGIRVDVRGGMIARTDQGRTLYYTHFNPPVFRDPMNWVDENGRYCHPRSGDTLAFSRP